MNRLDCEFKTEKEFDYKGLSKKRDNETFSKIYLQPLANPSIYRRQHQNNCCIYN